MSVYSMEFPKQLEGESNRNYSMFLQYNDCRDMSVLENTVSRRQCYAIAKCFRWKERLSEWDKAVNSALVNTLAEKLYRSKDKKIRNYVNIHCDMQDKMESFLLTHNTIYRNSGFDFKERGVIVKNYYQTIKEYVNLTEKITVILEEYGFDQMTRNNTKPSGDLDDFLDICCREEADITVEELDGYL